MTASRPPLLMPTAEPIPSRCDGSRRRGRAAFTLLEVMIAMTILAMAVAITMVVFLAALKRATHTELMLHGTAELRYAADFISEDVRSATALPTVQNGGLELLMPPKDTGYLTVTAGTWLDSPANTVQGWKSNQRTLQVVGTIAAVARSAFKGSARPSGAVSASDVGTYFVDAASLPTVDVNTLVKVNDTLSIPATAYGPGVDLVVNSISQNSGVQTITFTTSLGADVPDGTEIKATSPREVMFAVVSTGTNHSELRYYPDSSNSSTYTVLARDISLTPLTDPSNSGGSTTVPFAISAADPNTVTINLQKIPQGTTAGRTLQGVETSAFTRTDPTVP